MAECKFIKITLVFLISHIPVSDEAAEGRDDELSLHEAPSEVFSPAGDAEEEDEGNREDEEKDQEDQGEEWGMPAHSLILQLAIRV